MTGVTVLAALEPPASTTFVPQLSRHGAIFGMAAVALKNTRIATFFVRVVRRALLSESLPQDGGKVALSLRVVIYGDQAPSADCFAGHGGRGAPFWIFFQAHGPYIQTAGVQSRFGDHRYRSACPSWKKNLSVFYAMMVSQAMPVRQHAVVVMILERSGA